MVLLSSLPSNTFASLILATTFIAELIAAAAGHVVTSFIFLHPKQTLCAAFCSGFPRPFYKFLIFRQVLLVNLVGFHLNKLLLVLFARFANMP